MQNIDKRVVVSRAWDNIDINIVRGVIKERIKFKRGMDMTDDECLSVLKKTIEKYEHDEYVINLLGEKTFFEDQVEFWIKTLYRTRLVGQPDKK